MMQQQALFISMIICAISGCVQRVNPVGSIADLPTKTSAVTDVKLAQASPNIRSGTQLTIQLKSTAQHPQITPADLEAVTKTIERRLNGLGISHATIETAGSNRILVKLPGVSDPQQATRVIGSTARLEFREQKAGTDNKLRTASAKLRDLKTEQIVLQKSGNRQAIAKNQTALQQQYREIDKLFHQPTITGKNVSTADPQPLPKSLAVGAWEVAIEFDRTGGDAFAAMTKKMAGTGRAIGIFIDADPISTPTVNDTYAATGITGGKAVIAGNFTAESANDLAILLRSGALPVPIEIVANQKY
jgi:preprotein translocase subunit SecD